MILRCACGAASARREIKVTMVRSKALKPGTYAWDFGGVAPGLMTVDRQDVEKETRDLAIAVLLPDAGLCDMTLIAGQNARSRRKNGSKQRTPPIIMVKCGISGKKEEQHN